MRYKLAPCGCLTDRDGFVQALCDTHRVKLDSSGFKTESIRTTMRCPLGHPMIYSVEDDHFHCRCGAVASVYGAIIVNPDPTNRATTGATTTSGFDSITVERDSK